MQKFKFYGYAGAFIMLICWAGNWFLGGLRTHLLFFPLWVGFILLLDAWIYMRTNSSLIHRDLRKFIGLFIISVPVWWLFELLNLRNQNWLYLGREYFSDFEFFILASLNFSTVMPAVFETTELVSSFRWTRNLNRGPVISDSNRTAYLLLIIGISMLVSDLLWPDYFFVFMWISVYLIIEGLNMLLKNKTLIHFTGSGNWRPLYMLAAGCLCCGFLWELWNFYSYPKWIYDIPFVGFGKIFDMPVLGYLGYIPFSFELYAIYILISDSKAESEPYLRIS